jgi:hypothetical protein
MVIDRGKFLNPSLLASRICSAPNRHPDRDQYPATDHSPDVNARTAYPDADLYASCERYTRSHSYSEADS